jgi:hypothetical protein
MDMYECWADESDFRQSSSQYQTDVIRFINCFSTALIVQMLRELRVTKGKTLDAKVTDIIRQFESTNWLSDRQRWCLIYCLAKEQ